MADSAELEAAKLAELSCSRQQAAAIAATIFMSQLMSRDCVGS